MLVTGVILPSFPNSSLVTHCQEALLRFPSSNYPKILILYQFKAKLLEHYVTKLEFGINKYLKNFQLEIGFHQANW